MQHSPSLIQKTLFIVLIFLIGFALYSNTIHSSFQFDDEEYILRNEDIRDISDVAAIWNYIDHHARFISFYSFALNYHFHKYEAEGYHIVNIIIHCMNALFVGWMSLLLLGTPKVQRLQLDEKKAYIVVFSSLLFLVHPLQTQAVAYIVQRFASLATLFYLLTICLYLSARLNIEGRWKQLAMFLLAFISCLLGMFTKEITFTLPLAIILIEFCFFEHARIKMRYFVFAGAMLLLIPALFSFDLRYILLNEIPSGSHLGDIVTIKNYWMTQCRVVMRYLQLLVWPVGLNLDYDFAVSNTLFEVKTFLGFMFLSSFFAVGWLMLRKNVLIGFGILWMFLTLSVESSLIPIHHVIFEHRMYLPIAGLSCAIITAVFSLKVRRVNISFAVCFFLIVLSIITVQRNKVWKNKITLWSDVVKKSPEKGRPFYNLGNAYFVKKMNSKAMINYDKAIERNPYLQMPHINAGIILVNSGMYEDAISAFDRAESVSNKDAKIFANRAVAYRKLKKFESSLLDYEKAIELEGNVAGHYCGRGILYKNMKKYDLAIKDYNYALGLDPHSSRAYRSRGIAYWKKGNIHYALADLQKAMDIEPNYPMDYYNRSLVYRSINDFEHALEDAQKAKKLGFNVKQSYIEELKRR